MRIRDVALLAMGLGMAACDNTATSIIGLGSGGGSAGATRLVFIVQPTGIPAGAAIAPAVEVEAVTASGTDTSFTGTISVGLGTDPSAGVLSGSTTVVAVSGVAVFENLSVNNPGSGYTLVASSANVTPATSTSFAVTASTGATARSR